MQRLILVYNPRSSRYVDVDREVISRLRTMKGYAIGKYEVKPTNLDDNIAKLSKLLKDGDFVLAAGGDASGIIASNGILKSDKDATLAVLPYGNFNDLARTLGTMKFDDVFGEDKSSSVNDQDSFIEGGPDYDKAKGSSASDGRFEVVRDNGSEIASEPRDDRSRSRADEKLAFRVEATPNGRPLVDGRERSGPRTTHPSVKKLYPLEIHVDGKFYRYATCYVTIGMTAEACELFDEPKFRKEMQKGHKSSWRSYIALVKWYFKNRHKREFIPEFKLNGKLQHKKTSDYAAVSGRSMCRVMKGGDDYLDPKKFRSMTDRLTNFWRLFKLMVAAILVRTPGTETTGDTLEFIKPATVELQAEGEYQVFKNIKTIEIKKGAKCLKVIHN